MARERIHKRKERPDKGFVSIAAQCKNYKPNGESKKVHCNVLRDLKHCDNHLSELPGCAHCENFIKTNKSKLK